MKIAFLPDGSPDCPLVRLYDFDASEACCLQSAVQRLASGTITELSLAETLSVEAIDGCTLTMQGWDADQGIVLSGSGMSFVCRLSRFSWQVVAELISPFCMNSAPGRFQWLDETSPISWLLSPDGAW